MIAGAALSFAVMYVTVLAAWVLLTLRGWWRRRHAQPDVISDLPELGVYELARLARGRYGQIEVMMATLLEDRALVPGEGWDARDHNEKTWRLAVGGPLSDDAHELERGFVEAVRRKPKRDALWVASDVVNGEIGSQIDARLRTLGLVYDETGRWRLWFFGLALCLVGWVVAAVQPQSCCSPAEFDALTLGAAAAILVLMAAMPETMCADVTPNGYASLELERQCHPQLRVKQSRLALAIALHGTDDVRSAGDSDADSQQAIGGRTGLQLARELLLAESKKTI